MGDQFYEEVGAKVDEYIIPRIVFSFIPFLFARSAFHFLPT